MSDEGEAGYAKMADHMGRVRRIVTGDLGGLVVVAGDGVAGAAEAYLRRAAWERPEGHPCFGDVEDTYPPGLMTSGACIAELQRRVADVENLAANLAMQISVMQTDLLGVQTANAYLERRVSELQFAADAHGG